MKTIKQQLFDLAIITILAIILTGMILDGGMVLYPLLVASIMLWISIGTIALIRQKSKTETTSFERKYLRLLILPFWLIAAILNSILLNVDWMPGYVYFIK